MLYEAFPTAYCVLVEPLKENEPHLRRILQAREGEYVIAAAGSQSGTGTINVEPTLMGKSSLMDRTELTATGARFQKREIPIVTLDQIMEQSRLTPPFGLKIDTEGYELQVINGAARLLEDTQFVIAEISVSKRFEASYSFAEFIGSMDRHGFHLCDILSCNRSHKTGNIVWVDAMFRKF